MFILRWKSPSLDANKAAEIQVPVGAVVSNKASIRFTGKGASNYGSIQQENLMRLLENFADSVAPLFPTVGELWYDTVARVLKICTSTAPVTWKSVSGVETSGGNQAPANPNAGDYWFQTTGTSSGVMYVFTGLGRYPEGDGSIGGWAQVWPHIEILAGREEYDYVADLIAQLNAAANGGSGVDGTVITNLSQLTDLDADFYSKWVSRGSDTAVLTPSSASPDDLTIDPNSNDWDTLLASAKYAVNRLDMPATVVDDISAMPFVTDGHQAPASLTSLDPSDVRYPSIERRSNRRFGTVTLLRSFTETLNVLSDAVRYRYSLKGISGISGANHVFAGNVTTTQHAGFAGALGGGSSATLTLRFNFPTAGGTAPFLQSGGAIQVVLTHTPSGSPLTGDPIMKSLLDQRGVIRITADQVRIFSQTLPRAFAVDPIKTGFLVETPFTVSQYLAAETPLPSGATYTITGRDNGDHLLLTITCASSAGPMNGTMTFSYQVIRDTTTYVDDSSATVILYPGPTAYIASDKVSGSAFLI